MAGIVLVSMLISACITAASLSGLPVDWPSAALAVLVVAWVAGIIAIVLCLAIDRLS